MSRRARPLTVRVTRSCTPLDAERLVERLTDLCIREWERGAEVEPDDGDRNALGLVGCAESLAPLAEDAVTRPPPCSRA